uniref:D-lyxose ketol-isomerase n=1 Tax=Candidatus Kentrum sp. SD TaxID=2126332 RepID=A0A450YM26_9GAMM|nr:MAG: hypothetical protein BECKSD772F_GA0070984_11243 [Candidatus Kentron sp. SD]VFK48521.1 MAG: hypothetical protein BECKSD772E_GA0070983_11293 [Candidatus Kentron sp. SD]
MKRSEINRLIQGSLAFFETMKFHLPAWGHWLPSDWRGKADVASEVIENMLGWDLTDFGSGDFERRGLILFTIRNGNPRSNDKAYAEKIMIVREGQETPMHFHWHKMEDIINRGGGNLAVELYGSTDDESLSDQPIKVKIDGVRRTVEPGDIATLGPGESICLERGMYHRF